MICFSVFTAHIIEVGQNSNILVSSVMEETGGLGVDVVTDNGGSVFMMFLVTRKF